MMLNPSNPIMLTMMSAAVEAIPGYEPRAIAAYTCQAIYHIVAPMVVSGVERDAMQTDLDARQAEMAKTAMQRSENLANDLEAFHSSLNDLRGRNSHFSWEKEARRFAGVSSK
jgi:hypothetical protein